MSKKRRQKNTTQNSSFLLDFFSKAAKFIMNVSRETFKGIYNFMKGNKSMPFHSDKNTRKKKKPKVTHKPRAPKISTFTLFNAVSRKKGQASIANDIALFDKAIKNGVNINELNKAKESLLHLSLKNDHFAITKKLLNAGADIGIKNKEGVTPLHTIIVLASGEQFLKGLFLKGFSYEANDYPPKTPPKTNYNTAASLLLKKIKKKSLINAKDVNGNTPLHLAAQNGWITNIMKILIAKGADINAKNNKGETPLHLAVKSRRKVEVSFLKRKGANTQIRDRSKKTPLDVAKERGCSSIEASLRDDFNTFFALVHSLTRSDRASQRPALPPEIVGNISAFVINRQDKSSTQLQIDANKLSLDMKAQPSQQRHFKL